VALGERYRSARVPVTVAAPPGPLVVDGNADELRRMVANLLDNAVRHATARVEVFVESLDTVRYQLRW